MAKASKTTSAFFFFLIFVIFNFYRNFSKFFSLCLFFFSSCFRLTLLSFYTNRVNTENIIIRLLFSFLKYGWNLILLFHQTLHITYVPLITYRYLWRLKNAQSSREKKMFYKFCEANVLEAPDIQINLLHYIY